MSIYATRQYDGIYTQNPTLEQQREAAIAAQNPTAAKLIQDRTNALNSLDADVSPTTITKLRSQINSINSQLEAFPLDVTQGNIPPALQQAETAYQTAINSPTRYNMDKFQALDAEMGSFYQTGTLSPTAISTLQSLVPQGGDPMGGAAQVVKDWQSYNNLTNGGGKAVFPAISQLYSTVKQATGGIGDPSVDGLVSSMDSLLAKEAAPSGLNQLMGSVFAPAVTSMLAGGLLGGMGITGTANSLATSLLTGNPTGALLNLAGIDPMAMLGLTGTSPTTDLATGGMLDTAAGTGFDVNANLGLAPLSDVTTSALSPEALLGGGLAATALGGATAGAIPGGLASAIPAGTAATGMLAPTAGAVSGGLASAIPAGTLATGGGLLATQAASGAAAPTLANTYGYQSFVQPDAATGLLGGLGDFVTSNPGLVSTGLGLAGSYLAGQSATDAAQQSADAQIRAAQIAADAAKFKPVGVSTRFGQSQFGYDANGNLISAGYTPTADIKAQQDALMAASGGMLNQFTGSQASTAPMGAAAQRAMELGQGYLGTTPQEQAAKYMEEQQALLAPYRERELAALQAQNQARGRTGFSMGGTSTLGASNPEMEAYFNAKRMQDLNLAAQATQGGMDYSKFGTGMVGAGGDLLKGMFGTQAAAYSPYQTALGGATTLEGLAQQPMDIGINIGAKGTAAAGQAGLLTAQGIQGAAQTMQPANAYSPWGALLSGASQGLKQYTQPQQTMMYNPYTGQPLSGQTMFGS